MSNYKSDLLIGQVTSRNRSSSPKRSPSVRHIKRPRDQNVLYCVPSLFHDFGIMIPNKIYSYVDFMSLNDLGISIVITDSIACCELVLPDADETFLLTINQAHNHASKLERCVSPYQLPDDMHVDDLAVAMQRRQKKQPTRIVKEVKTAVREINKDAKKIKQSAKKARSQNERTPSQRTNKQRTGPTNRDVRAAYNSRPSMNGKNATLEKCSKLLAQAIDPANAIMSRSLIALSDDQSAPFAIEPSTAISTISSFQIGLQNYTGVIHSGNPLAQYYVAGPSLNITTPALYAFCVANLLNNDDGTFLIDAISGESPAAVNNFPHILQPSIETQIPLRTGFGIVNNNPCLLCPSELVTTNGSMYSGTALSFTGNNGSFFPIGTNWDVRISFSTNSYEGSTAPNVVVTVYGYNPYGTAVVSVIGSVSIIGAGVWSIGALGTSIFGAGNSGFIAAITMKVSGTSSVTINNINVAFLASNTVAFSTSIYTPYAYWTGVPMASFPTFSNCIDNFRPVAGAMLLTSTTPVLNASGQAAVIAVNQGVTPAESGIFGLNTLQQSTQVVSLDNLHGSYSVSNRLCSKRAEMFVPFDNAWAGRAGYTMALSTSNQPFQFRLAVWDIFEVIPEVSQQIVPTSKRNVDIVAFTTFIKMMSGRSLIAENPLHLQAIKDFYAKAMGYVKKIAPAVSIGARALGYGAVGDLITGMANL